MALTGQELISALATSIRTVFSTSEFATIYKDTPVQKMVKPCVFLHSVNTTHEPGMRDSARWHYIVDVRCHAADSETSFQTWASGIAVQMLEAVSRVTISEQTVKATNIEWNTEGGVLHVLARYSFSVNKKPPQGDNMETLETIINNIERYGE